MLHRTAGRHGAVAVAVRHRWRPRVKASAAKKKTAPRPASTAAKPVAKKAVKPVAKPAVKPAAKPAPKASGKKPAAKPVAKTPVKTSTKAVPKTPSKAPPKAPSKGAPKPASKTAATSPAKAASTPVPAPKAVTAVQVPKGAPATKPAPVAAPAAAAEPVRSGRVTARLAQITVPSMAQSVAATTAKSSYVSTMPSTVIAPMAPMGAPKDPKLANNWKTKPVENLTDAEVLAMPDGEYMNDKQMAFFRLRLVRLKQDILNNAGETTEHLREDTVIVPDPADRATIEEEHALELRTRDRERKLLKKIEQSIQHIDSGDYGYCDETGEPIGVGRLLARPTATLSLEAQQRRELKQKMFGD